MKTFLISNMYPSSDSPGYGVFVKNVVEGLEDYGFEFTGKAVIEGRSVGLLSKIFKYIRFYSSIVRDFFADYDFIYIHFPNQVIPLLNILYKFKSPRIVLNFHGEDLLYSGKGIHGWLGRSMESFCRRYATAIVVPSAYFADIVAARNIVAAERIIVSPSGGINENYFSPKEKGLIEDSARRPLHLGYVGRLEPGKGILEFLDLAKKLSESNIPYKATVIGYGTLKDQTEKFISDHGLGHTVSLIPGLSQSELADYYRDFDLLVFLSGRKEESLGLTGIEAMACGTPVVGSDVGGIASYLCDRQNGFKVSDISDIDGIAGLIEEYSRSSGECRRAMYEKSLATARRYFSQNVRDSLVSDLKRVMSNCKKRR